MFPLRVEHSDRDCNPNNNPGKQNSNKHSKGKDPQDLNVVALIVSGIYQLRISVVSRFAVTLVVACCVSKELLTLSNQ